MAFFKFEKISSKHLLFGLFIINILLLLSFIMHILVEYDIISNSFSFLALPIELITQNILIVLLILVVETFLVIFAWKKKKKSGFILENNQEDYAIDLITESADEPKLQSNLFSNESDQEIDELFSELDTWTQQSDKEALDFISNDSQNESIQQETSLLIDDNQDFSPGFLASDDELLNKPSDKSNSIVSQIKGGEDKQKSPILSPESLSEYQFAFFQNIVNNGWVYENSIDRERIGFDKNAIDESNISLVDLEKLIKAGKIYKKRIQHPTGPFTVFASSPIVEKLIINDTIRRICRKKRYKSIIRKIEFANWIEFGLAKKVWQFDFEISLPSIVGCIWDDNCFLISNNPSNYSIKQEKKDELKAVIAASSLKMKNEGTALIITNKKDHVEIIKKTIKNTGWGKAEILDFSDSKFAEKLIKIIENKK
ncbi:MAG: hypothetical protein KGD59_08920 [Candidatus Heimdallarchaeota archaeon]|nr:hypothetical protein [Candidatus Heimdallarchaeota archaeon]MBY8994658.1 hypothetical protein [Candidatus Heimdallarchaeota archaeon]